MPKASVLTMKVCGWICRYILDVRFIRLKMIICYDGVSVGVGTGGN